MRRSFSGQRLEVWASWSVGWEQLGLVEKQVTNQNDKKIHFGPPGVAGLMSQTSSLLIILLMSGPLTHQINEFSIQLSPSPFLNHWKKLVVKQKLHQQGCRIRKNKKRYVCALSRVLYQIRPWVSLAAFCRCTEWLLLKKLLPFDSTTAATRRCMCVPAWRCGDTQTTGSRVAHTLENENPVTALARHSWTTGNVTKNTHIEVKRRCWRSSARGFSLFN